jgi:MFS family permease
LSAAFLISAFSFVPLFYRDLPSIFFMQALSGLGFGIVSSATAGLVIRSVVPEQRGAAVGIYQSLYAAGVLIGPVVAGSITQAVSLEAAYWFLAGLSVAAALLCYLLIPKKYARM